MAIELKNKKFVKIGGSMGITIDSAYFKNGQLDPNKDIDKVIIIQYSPSETKVINGDKNAK